MILSMIEQGNLPKRFKRYAIAGVLICLVGSGSWASAQEPTPRLIENLQSELQLTPHLVRNQARLTLAGAEAALKAARAKAESLGLKVNIAVVDDGGHLLAFARMDGARPASGYTAMTKATTAATFRRETGRLDPEGSDPTAAVLLNLSLQNAANASGGKITTLPGGIPILADGQVVGAVGVGGATGEQDAEIARAAVAGILQTALPQIESKR